MKNFIVTKTRNLKILSGQKTYLTQIYIYYIVGVIEKNKYNLTRI